MKIAVTGTSSGFGKYLVDNWDNVYGISLRLPLEEIIKKVQSADVLINHAYSKDTKQSQLLYEVFNLWKHSDKVIVNFGSAAIKEVNTFDPLYVSNKKHLINLSDSLVASAPYKKVRVVNFNPSTLENNKIFGSGVTKLKFDDLSKILKFILELPKEIEISDIVIKSTQPLELSMI
jgi:hypothetical protein